MEKTILQRVTGYLARNRRRRIWRRVVGVLACLVVFCTTYALILPAITEENTVYCGVELHQHTEECYEKVLICGQEETGTEVHSHTSDCVVSEQALICENEDPEHQHTEECYETVDTYICGLKEGEEIPGHVHTEECYESVLTCDKPEHEHTLECFSNPEADVETAEVWARSVSDVELTGNWRTDLLAVAESQLDYTESTKNYKVDENEKIKGYSRYGAWYGDLYGDWCAMFVSFCLHYAEIPVENFPLEANCGRWIEALQSENWNLYREKDYTPEPGDLVFFDWDKDQISDHVGIVTELLETTETEPARLCTIEGDSDDRVQYVKYPLDDETILGYAELPGNTDKGQVTQSFEGEDYAITVTCGPEAKIPENARLTVRELADGEYEESCQKAKEAMNVDELSFARFFDVSFVADGEIIEPAAPVSVKITYANVEIQEDQVKRAVHFTEDGVEVLEAELEQNDGNATFEFNQDSFSTTGNAVGRAATPPTFDNTVSPSSSVINVFDYWIDERFPVGGDGNDGSDTTKLNAGINSGHALKFRKNWGGSGTCNNYVSDAAHGDGNNVQQGIVKRTLDEGYPRLSGDWNIVNGKTDLLDYLFDPDYNGAESNYRKVFRGVQGFLYDENGYYTYDSTQHYAYLNENNRNSSAAESGNRFTLYNTWAVSSNNYKGQFFPFNPYPAEQNISAADTSMYHYFGVTLTARFMQEYDGYTNASKSTPMTFNFSGDDDVWIFIDDVLVADLGGIHNKINTTIDFSTGDVEISYTDPKNNVLTKLTERHTTIRDAFYAAGLGSEEGWNENTFKNNTSHTLKFFYLERGNGESNMSLQYNLNAIPPTAVYKVNQYGSPVEGAKFAVYPANLDWTYDATKEPAYTGTTDKDGKMVFADQYGYYSLADMEEKFGKQFILKETAVPNGYRLVSDEVRLRIQGGALVCDNTYQSGVWASPTVQVTAPNTLTPVNTEKRGQSVSYYTPAQGSNPSATEGTLFAVVLKYNGSSPATEEDLRKQANWVPVYGNPEEGYSLVEVEGDTDQAFVAAVIDAATKYNNQNIFTETENGVMQMLLEGLPGKVVDYYYMLLDGGKVANTQYTIGYYYTSADSLSDANSSNTFRINAEDTGNRFYRAFGANIEVPNLANRLLVQKYDESKNLVNGATFALFRADGDNETYAANGIKVSLAGKTYVEDGSNLQNGQYTVEATPAVMNEAGEVMTAASDVAIKVKKNGTVYTILPHETRTTNSQVLEGSNGTCVFGIRETNLTPGCYYLREVVAPEGYKLNTTPIMVKVTDTAIYANAGTEKDGVTVARGPGYIVSPLHKAASEGDIDRTLSWIFQKLRVSGESSSFAVVPNVGSPTWDENGAVSHLIYTRNAASLGWGRYLANYEPRQGTDSTLTLSTDIGWSYNEIYQDYDYGKDQHGSANYTKIEGEITSLFSRTVYVQVTDERLSDLEISKKVTGDGSDPNTEFTFTVDLKDADDTSLTGSYIYTIYNVTYDADGKETGRTVALDTNAHELTDAIASGGTIKLKRDQAAVIKDLPGDAHYTITETEVRNYSASYRIDGGTVVTGAEASGALTWKEDGNRVTQVAFTNTYREPLNLTVEKYETGTSTVLPGAEFVLYKTENDKNYYYQNSDGTVKWVELSDAVSLENLVHTTNDQGKLTFDDLPDGTYFLEEVKAPDGYLLPDKPISLTVKDGKIAVGPPGNCTDDTIKVYNSTGIELPNTGGTGTRLFTMGGFLLMVIAVEYGYRRRRRQERRKTI